jgi:hypothetical protein
MSPLPEWLSQLWTDQVNMSASYFIAWGRMLKALPEFLTIDQMFDFPKNDIFEYIKIARGEDPDGLLRYFGGKDLLLSDGLIGSMTILFEPNGTPEIRKIIYDYDEPWNLGPWIFFLFTFCVDSDPERLESLGVDPLQHYLHLSVNAQLIHHRAMLTMAGWDKKARDYSRTSKANAPRIEEAKAVNERIEELQRTFIAKSPRFAKLVAERKFSPQAAILEKALKKEGLTIRGTSKRSIRRKLATRTYGHNN